MTANELLPVDIGIADGKIAALIWNVAGRSELALVNLASNQVIDTPACENGEGTVAINRNPPVF